MIDNKKIVRNTVFLYLRMLLVMGAALYTSRVVLQILGAEDFGLYNVVGGLVVMFTFLNGSLGAATSRYITFELGRNDYARVNKIFNVAVIIHILMAILITIMAETIGLWFFYEKMTIPTERLNAAFWVYQISILTCFFTLIQVPYNAMIIAKENMRIYAWVGIVEAILKLSVVFILPFAPIDLLVFYAILLCLIQIGITMFYKFYCEHHFEESNIKFCRDRSLYKEMFVFASSDLVGNVSVLAQGQGLNILLNVFFGPVVNAARGIAYQVQGAVSQFSNNFMTAVKPQIIKSYAEGDSEGMMRLVKYSSCFSFYLMWVICLPIILEAVYLLSLWLGKYPEHSDSFLRLVLILCLIQTLKTPRSTAFHATGHIKRVNIIVGGILCCAFPLGYLFLKAGYSPESVFIAAIITMIISEFVSVVILKRYIKYSPSKYLLEVHGRCLLVAIISGVLPYVLFDKYFEASFQRLIITCVLSTISIFITVWIIGLDRNMRIGIYKMIMNKIRHLHK